MRILPLLAVATLLAAPARAQSPESTPPCQPGDGPLTIAVTDAATGRPLPSAWVVVDGRGVIDFTKRTACHDVTLPKTSGTRHRVEVESRRYVSADTTVDVPRGESRMVRIALVPAPPACCRLEGEWEMTLVLDSAGRLEPAKRTTTGRMAFHPRLTPPARRGFEEEEAFSEWARFDVDLGVFFGGPYARDVSTTVYGAVTEDFFQQAVGEVFAGDSVMIGMIPGMSHGGLSLRGSLRDDTVRGRWVQNAYCCGARGRFEMHRVTPSAAGDSLVTRGARILAESIRRAEEEVEGRKARAGSLRLRLTDERTGRYAAASFGLERHAADGQDGSYTTSYDSGADGWGREYRLEPGRYDVLLEEFTCNGQRRFADEDSVRALPRVTLTVETGRRVDQDIRLDLCSIPEEDQGMMTSPIARPGEKPRP